jgi:hypothetical protein
MATSELVALQNKHNRSDIGGGPQMSECAVNAALKGLILVFNFLLIIFSRL